jgi:hypothetical protein
VLKDYHVDAEDRYNVTCDFGGVIRELRDAKKRFPFQVSCSNFQSCCLSHENCQQDARQCPATL